MANPELPDRALPAADGPLTLAELWQELGRLDAKAEMLRFALGRAIEFDGRIGVSGYWALVERLLMERRSEPPELGGKQ